MQPRTDEFVFGEHIDELYTFDRPGIKSIAKRVPYNKFLIKTANIYQMLAFALTGISREISCKRIIIRENGRLPLKVVIYEPVSAADKLPCLLYIHGGAFSYKASAHHKKLACIYALEANCRWSFRIIICCRSIHIQRHIRMYCPYINGY